MSFSLPSSLVVTPHTPPERIDLYLIRRGVSLSRSRIQNLIEEGQILINGHPTKASYRVREGDRIDVKIPPPAPLELIPEEVPLDVLYEDESLLVLNKAAGMVVHPAPGHDKGTLVHALLHHCRDLTGIGGRERPGIVHRLDKDTSGVMVIAKTDAAHQRLSKQFKQHTIDRRYLAVVCGKVAKGSGKIDLAIGRDRVDRKKISSRTAPSAGGANPLGRPRALSGRDPAGGLSPNRSNASDPRPYGPPRPSDRRRQGLWRPGGSDV